jgi:hypothetical protein
MKGGVPVSDRVALWEDVTLACLLSPCWEGCLGLVQQKPSLHFQAVKKFTRDSTYSSH